MDDVT